ncbi:MAG: hypothetical protein ABSB61_03615 [Anaerolineales bacterium]|jgi:hypothetical protein
MAAVKLLMTWDIVPGQEQEYFEFIIREFLPGLQSLGIEPTDAWYTAYGEGPQIMAGGTTPDMAAMRRTLSSKEWQELREKLLRHVENFNFKLVKARAGFQL